MTEIRRSNALVGLLIKKPPLLIGERAEKISVEFIRLNTVQEGL